MSREIDADIAGMDGEDMVDEIMELRQQRRRLAAIGLISAVLNAALIYTVLWWLV